MKRFIFPIVVILAVAFLAIAQPVALPPILHNYYTTNQAPVVGGATSGIPILAGVGSNNTFYGASIVGGTVDSKSTIQSNKFIGQFVGDGASVSNVDKARTASFLVPYSHQTNVVFSSLLNLFDPVNSSEFVFSQGSDGVTSFGYDQGFHFSDSNGNQGGMTNGNWYLPSITTAGSNTNLDAAVAGKLIWRDANGRESPVTVTGATFNSGTLTITGGGSATNAINNLNGNGTNATFKGVTTIGTNETTGITYFYGDGTYRYTNSTLLIGKSFTNGIETVYGGTNWMIVSNFYGGGFASVNDFTNRSAGVGVGHFDANGHQSSSLIVGADFGTIASYSVWGNPNIGASTPSAIATALLLDPIGNTVGGLAARQANNWTNVPPSSTSGWPLLSQGSSALPAYGPLSMGAITQPGVIFTNNMSVTVVDSNNFKIDVAHALYPSNSTPSRIAMIGADNTLTNAGMASAAAPINADGSASTGAQLVSVIGSTAVANATAAVTATDLTSGGITTNQQYRVTAPTASTYLTTWWMTNDVTLLITNMAANFNMTVFPPPGVDAFPSLIVSNGAASTFSITFVGCRGMGSVYPAVVYCTNGVQTEISGHTGPNRTNLVWNTF